MFSTAVVFLVILTSSFAQPEGPGPEGPGPELPEPPGLPDANVTCPDGTIPAGPCIGNSCPPGYECLDSIQQCCPSNVTVHPIVPTAVPIQPTASPDGCQDQVNPKTKKSECAQVALLCNVDKYYEFMTEQCPVTCHRCPIPADKCVDLVNPSTNESDCKKRKSLCASSVYAPLMRIQCPKTCGLCASTRMYMPSRISSLSEDLEDKIRDHPSLTSFYEQMTQDKLGQEDSTEVSSEDGKDISLF
ncbi:unnamed protein product [Cylicocyclus nassatus]|uniref:ShKT domain-containing protein n=1 Tax=Cylicocyclus nassatus TaxID=53992 RepID=A0AA36DRY8_CYLNA|nr:unnamed protein product [Cylicocyclus nassatus]